MALLTLIDLRSRDTLFILGDSIDRGPGSKEILDVLLRLTGNGYDIRVLRGNHEDMVLRCVSGHHDEYSQAWLGWWGEATLRSFGVTIPSEIPEEYLRFIGSMPLYAESDGFVLVHASLLSGKDPVAMTPPRTMLWGDRWLGKEGLPCGRCLVSGHRVVTQSTMKETLTSRHLLIDNGCFGGRGPEKGNLVALNLDTLEVTLQPLLDSVIPC